MMQLELLRIAQIVQLSQASRHSSSVATEDPGEQGSLSKLASRLTRCLAMTLMGPQILLIGNALSWTKLWHTVSLCPARAL